LLKPGMNLETFHGTSLHYKGFEIIKNHFHTSNQQR